MSGKKAVTRAEIVRLARAWLGTPYHHQASRRGVGCDCLGLVRGVFRALYGHEPERVPAYSPDWAEAAGAETLLGAARRHLLPIARQRAAAGDVLVLRFRRGAMAKHAAILTAPDRMIHACEGAAVSEVALSPWWHRRIAGVFSFPDLSD